jgi:hypothetical protein
MHDLYNTSGLVVKISPESYTSVLKSLELHGFIKEEKGRAAHKLCDMSGIVIDVLVKS